MATQYEPIVKDSTLNTTEQTPRNLADVLAEGLEDIANNVKPDASDIDLAPITGMSATNVQSGISELKGTLTVKAKEISGTTDAQGRLLSTGFSIANKAVVGVISGGHGQIALQLRLSNNNFAVKFVDSSGMSVVANTSCSCIVYYVDTFDFQT